MGIFTECERCDELKDEVKLLKNALVTADEMRRADEAEIERLQKELAEKDDYIRTVSRPVGAHSYE